VHVFVMINSINRVLSEAKWTFLPYLDAFQAMVQTVSRRAVTAETRLRSRASLGDWVALGQGFLRALRFSHVIVIPLMLHT
jgi:hypothetical protein